MKAIVYLTDESWTDRSKVEQVAEAMRSEVYNDADVTISHAADADAYALRFSVDSVSFGEGAIGYVINKFVNPILGKEVRHD